MLKYIITTHTRLVIIVVLKFTQPHLLHSTLHPDKEQSLKPAMDRTFLHDVFPASFWEEISFDKMLKQFSDKL